MDWVFLVAIGQNNKALTMDHCGANCCDVVMRLVGFQADNQLPPLLAARSLPLPLPLPWLRQPGVGPLCCYCCFHCCWSLVVVVVVGCWSWWLLLVADWALVIA